MKIIFDGILQGMRDETEGNYPELIESIRNNPVLLDPERFNLDVTFQIEQIMDCVLGHSCAAFMAYPVIDNILSRLFERLHGRIGCAGRARIVAKDYVEYDRTGTIPEDVREEKYYHMRGTPLLWMEFCEGITHLVHGNPNQYLIKLKQIMELYNGKE